MAFIFITYHVRVKFTVFQAYIIHYFSGFDLIKTNFNHLTLKKTVFDYKVSIY